MSDDLIPYVIPFEETPAPKLQGAPPWGQALSDRIHAMEIRQQRDRHHASNEAQKLVAEVRGLDTKIGQEPDSDGKGGKGLIGDVRHQARVLTELLDLKKMGIGAIAGISLFGTLIVLGFMHWVQSMRVGAK